MFAGMKDKLITANVMTFNLLKEEIDSHAGCAFR